MAAFWIFFPASLFGGLWDLRFRKIPNLLNGAILLAALAWHASRGDVLQAAWGAAAGFLALLVPYWLGGMGAGDVKFMAALGAAAGWPFAADTILWSALSGGVLVVSLAIRREEWQQAWLAAASGPREALKSLCRSTASRKRKKVPYALAMTAGFVLSHFFPLIGSGWVR
ncbi:MAG: prepilin peptidase [Synergistaceae bacterium]|nr:prepilin peptidase [Synergistaceae bacterium]